MIRNLTYPVFLVFFAFIIHFWFVRETCNQPFFVIPLNDCAEYHSQAVSELQGNETYFWKPHLYVEWLKMIFRLLGTNFHYVRYFQALFSLGIVLMTYFIGIRFLSPRFSLAASILIALNGPLLFVNAQMLPTGLGTLLGLLSLLLFLISFERRPYLYLFLSGIACGLAVLALPNMVVFEAVFILSCLFTSETPKPIKIKFVSVFLLITGFIMVLFPDICKRHRFTKEWHLFSSNGGINLYIGNNPNIRKTLSIRAGFEWEELACLPYRNGAKTKLEAERYFLRKAEEFALEQPFLFTKNLFYKMGLCFSAEEIPRTFDLYTLREYSFLLSLLVWKWKSFAFPFGIICPFALTGMWFSKNTPRFKQMILLIFLYLLSVGIIFPGYRYRIPLLPLFSILAAEGFRVLISLNANKRSGYAAFCFFFILINYPAPPLSSFSAYKAEMNNLTGSFYDYYGNRAEAMEFYKKSVNSDDSYYEGHFSLARAYRRENKFNEAIGEYKKVLELLPRHEPALRELAVLLSSTGDFRGACLNLNQLISLHPDDPENYSLLGGVLFQAAEYDTALHAFEQALKINPENAQILNNIRHCQEMIQNKQL